MSNKKLLIICYSFPPHPGIGGRRWAKFAKTLTQNSYEVLIINALNIFSNTSFWDKDVDKKKIKVISLKFRFQKILKNPKSVIAKVFRKIILWFINQTKYNPHIITSLPNKHIWNSVKKIIIEQKITKVIVSGDPYLFYYAGLLKKELDFELIIDYRDLWNDHSFYQTKISLSPLQRRFFAFAEDYAVNNCNKIITVDAHLKSIISNRIKIETITTNVIHNGFDKCDLVKSQVANVSNDEIRIFFAGSIASDLNELVLEFASAFSQLSKIEPQIYDTFTVSISGEIDAELVCKIHKLNLSNFVIKNHVIKFEDYYDKLKQSHVGLVILSDEYKNSFITKFTDYVLYNKFILSLGYKGEFTEYVESKNIGMSFDTANPIDSFKRLSQKIKEYKPLNESEKEKFELGYLTSKLINEVIEA